MDAWIKVYLQDGNAWRFLEGLILHLDEETCVGPMSEVFDAEFPFTPRGCITQGWTVGEFPRCGLKTGE